MTRYGSVIQLRSDKAEEYKQLHAAAWPEVCAVIRDCHIRNYSIYLRRLEDGRHYLFSYFEYDGDDFSEDMAKMAPDPVTQKWWSVCKPCHIPLSDCKDGEWWASMDEVFHQD
jgi:L-rhamnose mutarotase